MKDYYRCNDIIVVRVDWFFFFMSRITLFMYYSFSCAFHMKYNTSFMTYYSFHLSYSSFHVTYCLSCVLLYLSLTLFMRPVTLLISFLCSPLQVALVSGDAFGAPDCIRISYAASLTLIEDSIDRLKIFLLSLEWINEWLCSGYY